MTDEMLPLDMPMGPVISNAVISDDEQYRYVLTRRWTDHGTPVVFVMLNPSTADAFEDDPTIRRCIGFAKALGGTSLVVVNLYAYRATKPTDLWKADDPVGPDNDHWLQREFAIAAYLDSPLIAAWGAHARADRVKEVMAMPGAERFRAYGRNKGGSPKHPLYLKGDSPLTAYPSHTGA